MPSRSETRTQVRPSGRTVFLETVNTVWTTSARVNGKLQLVANPHSRQNSKCLNYTTFGRVEAADSILMGGHLINDHVAAIDRAFEPLEAESYARLRGKLYKGSAALGVTIASWKQSREMIVNRYRQMSLQSDSFERRANSLIRLDRKSRQRKIAVDKLGGQYLEMVFGWQPLLTDIHAALRTVINSQPQAQWVSASAKTYLDERRFVSDTATLVDKRECSGVVRVNRTTMVEVSNPNTWLRERAGLNNPAAVVWDLVPWSFVVNMFVNTGQLVNSVTDFAGLQFMNDTTTKAYVLTARQTAFNPNGYPEPYGGQSAFLYDTKIRTMGAVTRPPLVMKLPDVNWELAAIAASLFLQKFRRVSSLVNL